MRTVQTWISSLEECSYIRMKLVPDELGSKRFIAISGISSPHEENFTPPCKNLHGGHEENFTHNNTVNNTSNKNTPVAPKGVEREKFSERFERFWKHYPRKTGKGAAENSFMKYKPSEELTQKMIDAVDALKASEQWQKDGGRFIPLPATWLNGKRWEDEIPQGSGGGEEDNWGGIPKL